MEKRTIIMILMFIISTLPVFAGSFTISGSDFDDGEYTNVVYNGTDVVLITGQSSGTYISDVYNIGGEAMWNDFHWSVDVPDGYPDNSINDGIIDMTDNELLYHMDEESGTIIDSSGKCHNGVITGNITYGHEGIFNNSLFFENGNIYIPCHPDTSFTREGTYFTWIRPTVWLDRMLILKHRESSSIMREICVLVNGTIRIDIDNKPDILSNDVISLGSWHFLLFTWDNNNDYYLYIDGVLDTNGTFSTNVSEIEKPMRIGNNPPLNLGFKGYIDEFGMFSRYIPPEEQLAMYNRGIMDLIPFVRTCQDISCSGQSFVEFGKESPQEISNLIVGQYLQFKFNFVVGYNDASPNLNSVNIDYTLVEDFGLGTYSKYGGDDSYFKTGRNLWSSSTFDYKRSSKAITNPNFVPLVADLNYDGVNEIVVLDGNELKVFHGRDLIPVVSYTLQHISLISTHTAQFELYDINGNGKKEIIICDSSYCEIIDYTDDSMSEINYISISTITKKSGFVFGCGGINECVYVYSYKQGDDGYLKAFVFGTEGSSTPLIIDKEDSNPAQLQFRDVLYCMPYNPYIIVKDINFDGDVNYVFTVNYEEVAYLLTLPDTKYSIADVMLISVYVNKSDFPNEGSIILDKIERKSLYGAFDYQWNSLNPTCDDGQMRRKVTSPLLVNTDGFSGYEVFIGHATSYYTIGNYRYPDEFKIGYYDNEFDHEYNMPYLLEADGLIMSNPVLADVFEDTGYTDICVLGYVTDEQKLDLLCGSPNYDFPYNPLAHSDEFETSLTYDYSNYTINASWRSTLHSTQSITTVDYNPSEFLTPYGIFRVDFEYINELKLVWEVPHGVSFVLSNDVEAYGLEDLLIYTETNLFYYDDKYTNSPPEFSQPMTIIPCVEKTWIVNTTVGMAVTPVDDEKNKVSARFILYSGTSFEQDSGWTDFVNSGTTINSENHISFIANKTIANGVIKLMIRDNFNPIIINSMEVPFTVLIDGEVDYESGCISNFDDIITVVEEEEERQKEEEQAKKDQELLEEGVVGDLGNFIQDILKVPLTLFSLILIAVISFALIKGSPEHNVPSIPVEGVAIVDILLLFIFSYVGWISWGWAIILIVFIGFIGVLYFKKVFSPVSVN